MSKIIDSLIDSGAYQRPYPETELSELTEKFLTRMLVPFERADVPFERNEDGIIDRLLIKAEESAQRYIEHTR